MASAADALQMQRGVAAAPMKDSKGMVSAAVPDVTFSVTPAPAAVTAAAPPSVPTAVTAAATAVEMPAATPTRVRVTVLTKVDADAAGAHADIASLVLLISWILLSDSPCHCQARRDSRLNLRHA